MKYYAKRYCEIRASLCVETASLGMLIDKLQACENSAERDEVKIAKCKQSVAEQKSLVDEVTKKLKLLEYELRALSMDLSDCELRIFIAHYIKGYSLKETARRMYYSYDRIKQIHRRLKAKMTAKI